MIENFPKQQYDMTSKYYKNKRLEKVFVGEQWRSYVP